MSSKQMFQTESDRWSALQCRNRAAHSSFVYAVTTTKIYCRPTCPSRLARRANVRFFDYAAQAIVLGFRACKRCKPEITTTKDHTMMMVNQACQVIEAGLGDVSMTEAARAAGITTRHLHTLFRSKLGCTPAEYARHVRWQTEQLSCATLEPNTEIIPPLPELIDDEFSIFDRTNSSPDTTSSFTGLDDASFEQSSFWQDELQYSSLNYYSP